MESIAEQFLKLKIAAIASGKISTAEINEATRDVPSDEQRLSALKEVMAKHNVAEFVESADAHYSQKFDDLLEKVASSEKVKPFQIMESLSGCTNARERFDALHSLALAKYVIEVPRIARKNGSTVLAESNQNDREENESDRIAHYAKKLRCSIREATIFATGKDPGPNVEESSGLIAERAARWKKYCGVLSEQDCRTLAEKGLEP